MSRIYILALTIATVLVSITGAFFSVKGLSELFAGAKWSVVAMSSALEFSKFVLVGVLYRYWGHIHKPLRAYLCFAICTLMVITSAGIYGYLSNAYHVAAIGLNTQIMEIEALENENARIQSQIAEMKTFIDNIPPTRISKKFELQKEYEPKFVELRLKSEALIKDIAQRNLELLSSNTKVGPVVHLAKFIGLSLDATVNMLICVFVVVFDPLAVAMVFCLNLLIRLREKYRGNEFKIGAHSLTSPVDHRFKRGA